MRISRTKPFDFTQVEPDLPQKSNARLKTLKLSQERWVKVVLKNDFKYGSKVLAKAGSTAWATYCPARKNVGLMISNSWSKKQVDEYVRYVRSAHYSVRIIDGGTNPRPLYKGEPGHLNVRIEVDAVKVIK